MLKLVNIKKDYKLGSNVVTALNEINLEFRKCEFVSILGPSGCGKTTFLNIVGGLDRYTNGDLLVNNQSTKEYKDRDWDNYRNYSIGFVFQNYNLISHISVLSNVEMALTLSGIKGKVAHEKALNALTRVGLADHVNKRPNQLSGGQMQRVAIARALVNEPDIILADEPTGALDSKTSVEIMNLLAEIAETRLVIMVTHNDDIANNYSNRIIRFLDGKVLSDSNPCENITTVSTEKNKTKTAMSFIKALSLSFNNLITKKTRAILTSFAGSIGIVGIALVLALSSGFSNYIDIMQKEVLSGMPLTISQQEINFMTGPPQHSNKKETDNNKVSVKEDTQEFHTNIISNDLLNHISKIDESDTFGILFTYNMILQLMNESNNEINSFNSNDINMTPLLNNETFINSQYILLSGNLPTNENEVVVILDEGNQVSQDFLDYFNITDESFSPDLFLDKKIKVIHNNDFYSQTGDIFTPLAKASYEEAFSNSNNIDLTVVGVISQKNSSSFSTGSAGSIGVAPKLIDSVLKVNNQSDIAQAQLDAGIDTNIMTGVPFQPLVNPSTLTSLSAEDQFDNQLKQLGAIDTPQSINIYPTNFESKDIIVEYLNEFNVDRSKEEQISFTDYAKALTDVMNTLISTITTVLVAFAAISLVVSSVMIGIITYVSVVERTKEIGVLRSLGARKKDIARVFNAETIIIGLTAGIMGIVSTLILSIPINIVLKQVIDTNEEIAALQPNHAVILIVLSVFLTFIAGLIPSSIAAKKDPVTALRTE